jgi:hypothetical protein
VHHIVSRGSGGSDEEWNRLNLCRRCHTEAHSLGWLVFGMRYPRVYGRIVHAREMAGRTTKGRADGKEG